MNKPEELKNTYCLQLNMENQVSKKSDVSYNTIWNWPISKRKKISKHVTEMKHSQTF